MRHVLIRCVATAATAVAVLTAAGCTSTGTVSHTALSLKPSGATGTPTSPPTTPDTVASKDFSSATPSSPSTASGTSATDFGPIPPASTALVARFSPYPAGARPWVKNKTGPLALDEFVELFYVEDAWTDEKSLAKQRGMQGVARHGWFNKDESQTELYLVKFSAAHGAQDIYQDLMDSWADKTGSVTSFDAPAVHGKGLIDPVADSQGDTTVKIAFVVNDVFVYMRYYTPGTPDKTGAMALALKQYTTLKAGH
jgi:hypothetical protein